MICKEVQPDLALAAVGVLDATRLQEVSEHCRKCPECAARLQEYQFVSEAHGALAGELTSLPLRYRGAPRPAQSRRNVPREWPMSWIGDWRWRWLVPVGVTVGLAVAFLSLRGTLSPPREGPRPALTAQSPMLREQQSPSLAAYRSAFKDAGEASLDALLARHEQHLLPRTPDQEIRQLRRQL